MLRSTKDLENYTIEATDGPIGHVRDFYFDDDAWVVRYLVVEAGSWLSSRKVLVSPIALRTPDWAAQKLPVAITQAQVRSSPDIDTDKPVSRQNEEAYFGYYGYPAYWGGAGVWGEGMYPYAMDPTSAATGQDRQTRERQLEDMLIAERARHRNDDPHLRSCNAVTGYHIQASDGEIGHVAGFLLDEQTWAVRYMVVDTSNWWMGHKVLVAPSWISGVHWNDRTVSVQLSQATVKSAPVYVPGQAWTPELDLSLERHHGISRAGSGVA